MNKLDPKIVKEAILKFLNEHGPSLPIQVAKAVNLSTLFASAFLSELSSEGTVKISDLKVGGSPVYFTPQTNIQLENFYKHLNQREQEAFLLIKEKKFLKDEEQTPIIRVALRGLKDFAIPLNQNGKIIWRYFQTNESELLPSNSESRIELEEKAQQPPLIETKTEEALIITPEETKIKNIEQELLEKQKELEKFKEELEKLKIEKIQQIEKPKLKKAQKEKKKQDDSFLNEIKPILEKKEIGILEIDYMDKREILAKGKIKDKSILLIVLNKKKIEEEDIIKAHKKSQLYNLPYTIFSKGEASKKTKEAIQAYKSLDSLEKLE